MEPISSGSRRVAPPPRCFREDVPYLHLTAITGASSISWECVATPIALKVVGLLGLEV